MMKAQVLVVEDNTIVAKDIQYSLKQLGYTVPTIAFSGEEAILEAEEIRPDLVLMDIRLKGDMDGVEAARQIHERFDIPVIYLTAHSDDSTIQRAETTQSFGYLLKPFLEKELNINIQMALYKHTLERQLKESEQWFSTTLRCISDAVIATNKRGFITFINPVAEVLTGWKEGEALGKDLTKVFHIVHEETRTIIQSPVAQGLRQGIMVGSIRHAVLIARDKTETPIDGSAAPIKDEKGNILGLVLAFRDITE